MTNKSTHTLDADQAYGNTTDGYLVFNGSPAEETTGFVTRDEEDELVGVRAKTKDEAISYLVSDGFRNATVSLEPWTFNDAVTDDEHKIEVWVLLKRRPVNASYN